METTNLQKNIMRRVYYAYTLRLATHPLVLATVVFGTALVVFARHVHVARIIEALESMPLASVPSYVFNALTYGEAVTLLALGFMCFASLFAGAYVGRLMRLLLRPATHYRYQQL